MYEIEKPFLKIMIDKNSTLYNNVFPGKNLINEIFSFEMLRAFCFEKKKN